MPEEKKEAPAESVNESTGMVSANPQDFLHEDEGHASEGEESKETPKEEEEQGKSEGEEGTESSEKGEGTETSTEEENQKKEGKNESEEGEEEQLYAGKYKTVDELAEAYRELGGNPERYSDPKDLEEAYLVRQAEFTRSRQDIGNQGNQDNGEEPTADQIIEEAIGHVDFSKVQNAKDAVREAIKVTMALVQQYFPRMDEGKVVERLQTQIHDRDKKLTEIARLEGDVPRLESDPLFRRQFAHFVKDQRNKGTYLNLKRSMAQFLDSFSGIVDEASKARQRSLQGKQSATTPAEKGEGTQGAEGEQDETDEILGAFEKKKAKFG